MSILTARTVLPARPDMTYLVDGHLSARLNENRPYVLAVAEGAMQLGNEVNRENALIASEFAGVSLEIDIVRIVALEAEREYPEARIDDGANGGVPRGIEFLDQDLAR